MKKIFLLVGLIWSAQAIAEDYDDILILDNGDTLKGKISYHWEQDLVTIDQGVKTKVFTADRVDKFEYLDANLGIKRFHISLTDHLTKRDKFFELIVEGELNLLRTQVANEQRIEFNQRQLPYQIQLPDHYHYYFMDGSSMVRTNRLKKYLKEYLGGNFFDTLQSTVRDLHGDLPSLTQVFLMVDYYNQMRSVVSINSIFDIHY